MSTSARSKFFTKKELEDIPRWAAVAFAARCARRVQPLFQHFWPEASTEHVQAIERAISLAEKTSSDGRRLIDSAAISAAAAIAAAAAAAYAAAYVAYMENTASSADIAYGAAAQAATYAAHSAYTDKSYAEHAAHTATFAADAASGVSSEAKKACIIAMYHDFGPLHDAAYQNKWTDDTAVVPQFFGSIWPEGQPENWPEVS